MCDYKNNYTIILFVLNLCLKNEILLPIVQAWAKRAQVIQNKIKGLRTKN